MEFVIEGTPVPKGRPRFYNGRAVTPQKTRAYEEIVAWTAKSLNVEPTESPVKLSLEFVLPVPASWSRKKREAALAGEIHHTGRPDAENMSKACCDAFNEILYKDDSQIVELHLTKRYGETPHTRVTFSHVLALQQPPRPGLKNR